MFKQSIGKWWHHLRGRQRTPKFYRGQEKFRARYPTYQIGIGTYGMPEVFDWHEGSTFSIGAYCSISSEVKVLLGGGIVSTGPAVILFRPLFEKRVTSLTTARLAVT